MKNRQYEQTRKTSAAVGNTQNYGDGAQGIRQLPRLGATDVRNLVRELERLGAPVIRESSRGKVVKFDGTGNTAILPRSGTVDPKQLSDIVRQLLRQRQ
jgi:hypothetical protein